MSTDLYDSTFYRDHDEVFRASAAVIVPRVVGWFSPRSVVDVGCGQGVWLEEARHQGVSDVHGVDGEWIDESIFREKGIPFTSCDLSEILSLGRHYDLALCMEVAEHIPAVKAGRFVDGLCELSNTIVFSAAVPKQGGTGHVNEQYPSYWRTHFDRNGFECFDLLRPLIWEDERVGWWYRQNALLYVRRDRVQRFPVLSNAIGQGCLDRIHPEHFQRKISFYEKRVAEHEQRKNAPTLRQAVGSIWKWTKNAVRNRRHLRPSD